MTALYLLGKPKACSHEECSETKGQLTYNTWLDNAHFTLLKAKYKPSDDMIYE